MKSYDVVAIGELLIDFTENGLSEQGNPLLEANPGGAPCNVLAMLAKLGRRTAFIGKVGKDQFGRQLKEAVEEAGIDTRALHMDDTVHTTLAFVHKKPDGDRDFSFYRNPGADIMLRADEVDEELIAASRVFHFGSLSLTHPEVREATHRAVELARRHGCMISFDPNLRPPLWSTLDEAKEQIAWGLEQCDVLKISDNEIQWFTGKDDFDEGIAFLTLSVESFLDMFQSPESLFIESHVAETVALDGYWYGFATFLSLFGRFFNDGCCGRFCGLYGGVLSLLDYVLCCLHGVLQSTKSTLCHITFLFF